MTLKRARIPHRKGAGHAETGAHITVQWGNGKFHEGQIGIWCGARATLSLRRLAMSSAALSPLAASLTVALGGGIGALGRYQLGRAITHAMGAASGFPWATLCANVIGSMAMGLLFGWFARHGGANETIRLFIGVGLLGGFTTFSAFSLELLQLVQRGSPGLAVTYAGVSVAAGLAALYFGLLIVRGAA